MNKFHIERKSNKPSYYIRVDDVQVFFRSYLEMKWAYFFDILQLEWEYEPTYRHLGINYTPDFFVKGFGALEIKPTVDLLIQENRVKLFQASKIFRQNGIALFSAYGEMPYIRENFWEWSGEEVIRLEAAEILWKLRELSDYLQKYETIEDLERVVQIILNTSHKPIKNPVPLSHLIPDSLRLIESDNT